jgi:tRNA(Ile)-lysidine synthase
MPGDLKLISAFQHHLDTCLDDWQARFGTNFILGLSGGGDSMALALGCARWVAAGSGRTVHAVCVDHGLRPGSVDEAQQTLSWAEGLGLTAHSVSLNLQPGSARLQERAREGRHAALCEMAQAKDARVILLAHTRDDQRETLALRLASKTGLDGLAGMATLSPSPFHKKDWPCLLGRPLLGVERDALRDHLKQAGQAWHEDPSNSNMAFGRIRARARLAQFGANGSDIYALNRIAAQAALLRDELDRASHDVLSRAGIKVDADHIRLSYAALGQATPLIAQRALGWLSFSVGGATRQANQIQLENLRQAVLSPHFAGRTLAGAKFQQKNDQLIVTVAPPRNGSKIALPPTNTGISTRLAAISGKLDQFVTFLG